jgi:hypothetical protein
MPEQAPVAKPLSEDDYCLIIGKVYLDAYLRIQSLEKQLGPMHASFRSQVETLRNQVTKYEDALREKDAEIASLKKEGSTGDMGT